MYIDSEDVHVTKLVDIVTRIPKQLSLHFYDFTTNLYRFYNSLFLETKRKTKPTLAYIPLESFGDLQIGPRQT